MLDKAALDRAQDISVADLLARTPGVTISRNGGAGGFSAVRIRGAEGEQTVTVIDGVKIADVSAPGGGYDYGNLLVGDASRIEVLRGPQSTLWGSQAIGGVVNIVTAQPDKDLEGSFDAEAGSRQTALGRAAIGGRSGPVAFRVGGQAYTTDGISAISPRFGGLERDGYRNLGGSGRLDVTLADGVALDLRGYYARGRVDNDASFGAPDVRDYSISREWIGYGGLNADLLGGRLRNRIGISQSTIDRDSYAPASPPGRQKSFDSDGRTRRIEYQGTLAITERANAVFGAERETARFRAISPQFATVPDRGRARITSVYAQVNGEVIDGLALTGGIRRDDHSNFGGRTLLSGGAAWSLPTGTLLRANYGEGFKAPTLYQLLSQFGNTALRPEQAKGWEAGAEQRLFDTMLTVGATWFERRTRDLIDFASCPFVGARPAICFVPGTTTTRFGYYTNINRAFARGIEASAALRPMEGLLIDGNYSWIAAENRSPGANFGRDLARRPRHAANGSISYAWPFGLTTGAAVRWSGASFEEAANLNRLDDYTLVDLRAEYDLGSGLRLFGRVENLFDERYETVFRYGTTGRSYFAGIRGRF